MFYHERSQALTYFILVKKLLAVDNARKKTALYLIAIEMFYFPFFNRGQCCPKKLSTATVIAIVDFNQSSNASFCVFWKVFFFSRLAQNFSAFHCLSFLKKGSDRLTRFTMNSLSYNLLWRTTKTETKLKTSSGRVVSLLFLSALRSFCFGKHTRN